MPHVSAQTNKAGRRGFDNTDRPKIIATGDGFDMDVFIFEFDYHSVVHESNVCSGIDNLFDG
jgi:hypothetical protein